MSKALSLFGIGQLWHRVMQVLRLTPENPDDEAHRYWRLGLVVLALYGLFLASWSGLAPLAGATMAPGVIVVDGNRKTVQHLNGGVVKELLVAEGHHVAEGEPLMLLDGTLAEASLDALSSEYWSYLARLSRLHAERDNLPTIEWSADLIKNAKDLRVQRLMADESSSFEQRRKALIGQISILESRIAQFNKLIAGLQSQLNASAKQRAHLREELADVQQLFDQGFERKPRLLQLRRQVDEITGMEGRLTEEIAKTQLTIAETDLNIRDLENQNRSEIVNEINTIQTRVFEIAEKIRAARHVVDNLIINAPRAGVVVDLQIHTVGGVISPGQPLMDIVPISDALVVEGRVRPEDINEVQVGLLVEVALTSYKQSITPRLKGKVTMVSADRLTDPQNGTSYFLVRASIPHEEREKVLDLDLSPGMPAEMYIVNKPSSAFTLLFQPFTDSMNRSFTR